MAIRSFKCADTSGLFQTGRSRRFAAIKAVAERKLLMLENAVKLSDLNSPPGNRLEPLVADRKGQHSIRINDQFRICFFRWTDTGVEDVEIVDYH